MTMVLEFYFSPGSRYSYLALTQMPRVETSADVRFDWIPVDGKRIRALRGRDPFAGPAQSAQYEWDYRERDATAWARLYRVPYVEPASVEFDSGVLLTAVLAAAAQGAVRRYAVALAGAVYGGVWPLDAAATDAVAERLDLDLPAFRAARDHADTAAALERNCQRAVQRGVFGVPTFGVDDALYWGNDRLPLVEHALRQRAAPAFAVNGLDHVVLSATDAPALVRFYVDVLGCRVERTIRDGWLTQLRAGDSLIDIVAADHTAPAGAGNMDHFCLRVDPFDADALAAHLRAHGCQPEPVERVYAAVGYGPSVYFRDPAGNRVELKGGGEFPPGG